MIANQYVKICTHLLASTEFESVREEMFERSFSTAKEYLSTPTHLPFWFGSPVLTSTHTQCTMANNSTTLICMIFCNRKHKKIQLLNIFEKNMFVLFTTIWNWLVQAIIIAVIDHCMVLDVQHLKTASAWRTNLNKKIFANQF